MSEQPADLIDAVAAAAHFRVQPVTIRQWARRYDLPAYGRERRRVLYSLSDLIQAEVRAGARGRSRS